MLRKSCWAIIPARGGSTGVVGKNIKNLSGIPLIGRTIRTLREAKVFNEIIVTSDSDEILSVAKKFGATPYKRINPEESNNVAMPDLPTISFLETVPIESRPKYCFMCQCTSPFVKATSYQRAYKKLIEQENSTVFAAHFAHSFLWQRADEMDSDSTWIPINHPFHERVGRQFSKVEQVNETGAFYGFETSSFLKARHRFFAESYPIIIKGNEVVDINDTLDWDFAEFLTREQVE